MRCAAVSRVPAYSSPPRIGRSQHLGLRGGLRELVNRKMLGTLFIAAPSSAAQGLRPLATTDEASGL